MRVVIIAEGETEAARLSDAYPEADVAILPLGAKHFTEDYADQLRGYDRILIATDADEAGDEGAAKIANLLPKAERFRPPVEGTDWCEADEMPPLPEPGPPAHANAGDDLVLVSAGELMRLELPERDSHFAGDLLPVAGSLMIHGWTKSYKSFVVLDMVSALAQGTDWAGFEPTDEPAKVVVMQYEIPYAYYRQRIAALRAGATHGERFDQNFVTYRPLSRPQFVAGKADQEDALLKLLEGAGAHVLVLDPIRRAAGGADLNSEKEVRAVLHFLQRVNDLGITTIAVHHDNKASARAGGGDPLAMTGSGAFAGDVDSIVSVGLLAGEDARSKRRVLRFTLRNAPPPSARLMTMTDAGRLTYSTDFTEAGEDDAGNPLPGI